MKLTVNQILHEAIFRPEEAPDRLHCFLVNANDTIVGGLLMSPTASKLDSLFLVGNGQFELVSGLPSLATFPKLRELRAEHVRSVSPSALGPSEVLEILALDHTDGFTDFTEFAPLPRLRELSISNCSSLRSLGGLERFPLLERVAIVDCPLFSDARGVVSLEKLKDLRIANTGLSELAPIASCRGLKLLSLRCTHGHEPKFDADGELRIVHALVGCSVSRHYGV